MIKFKDEIKELRYESNFYKGTPIKIYKTIFTVDKVNELVSNLSIKSSNDKKQFTNLTNFDKLLICSSIGLSLLFVASKMLIFILLLFPIFLFNYKYKYIQKEKLTTADFLANNYNLKDFQNGRHLSIQDAKGIYTFIALDFFENEKLVYEYTYFESTYSKAHGYHFKKTHETCLIFLDKLEKIICLPEGIELKGIRYFSRYNGHTYYNYPYAFIPNYIEKFDEILDMFKSLSIKYNIEIEFSK